MRIRMNDRRERRYTDLCDAAGEKTKAKAIDTAVDHYLNMAGGTDARKRGAIAELMSRAVAQGSVTPVEITDVLDHDTLEDRDSSS